MNNIFKWSEVCRVLDADPRQIRSNYSGKMYIDAVNELRAFEDEWREKWGKKKTNKSDPNINNEQTTPDI